MKNFEKAIGLSEGDVIILSDQDDVWMPDRLQKIEQYLLAHPEMDAVFSDAELVDKELHPYAYTLWDSIEFNERERSMVASGNAFDVLLRRNVVTGATLAFRGHVKARVLPIPGEWVHDEWLAMIIAATGRLGFLPERLIRYRQHGANQIGARKLGLLEKFRLLFTRRADFHRNLYLKTRLLRVRLAELATATTASHLTQELDRKLDHLAVRTRLPGPRFLRLGLVTKELVRGRYFRYSSGWKSVVRDLLEPL